MFNLTGNPVGSTIKTYQEFNHFSSVQFSSVAQSCLTLCDPMNSRTPGLLSITNSRSQPKLYVHLVGEAIQPSHPLWSPSPPALNLSQHQGLFKLVSSSHQMDTKYWSFSFSNSPSNEYSEMISFRMDWLDLQSKGLSRVFSNTTVQKHQFFHAQLSL